MTRRRAAVRTRSASGPAPAGKPPSRPRRARPSRRWTTKRTDLLRMHYQHACGACDYMCTGHRTKTCTGHRTITFIPRSATHWYGRHSHDTCARTRSQSSGSPPPGSEQAMAWVSTSTKASTPQPKSSSIMPWPKPSEARRCSSGSPSSRRTTSLKQHEVVYVSSARESPSSRFQ